MPVVWALCGLLHGCGVQVQIFDSHARPAARQANPTLCGLTVRHLDSWLMSPSLCRESFAHGARGADLALVMGRYGSGSASTDHAASRLDEMARWIGLPQLVVLDVSACGDCRLPRPLPGVVGLFLYGVQPGELARMQTTFEALWGVPVLGALPDLPPTRAMIRRLAGSKASGPCPCKVLGKYLAPTVRSELLWQRASCAPVPGEQTHVFQAGTLMRGLRVAVAYDEAFSGYLPDVLDVFDLQGASVRDFSPLRDDRLPSGTDLVYVGGGDPLRYARALAANSCLLVALRDHVQQGGRLYAECGGLAYLCRHVQLPSGRRIAMTGVLPAKAVYEPHAGRPYPAELTLSGDSWLAPRGCRLRGYRERVWRFEPTGSVTGLGVDPNDRFDFLGYRQALGSGLYVNLACRRDLLVRFGPAPFGSPDSAIVR